MNGIGDETDETYVQARRGLLDALAALGPDGAKVILVGAQAVYLHTRDVRLGVALYTKDADILLVPPLETDADLDDALREAGFRPGPQPGIWLSEDRQVDFLVPDALSTAPGRRAARIPGQDERLARNVAGLEGAAVDNEPAELRALEPGDRRRATVRVAGPAALLVAKLWKLAERADSGGSRLIDKDAFDAFRLLQLPLDVLTEGFRKMLGDPVARPSAETGLTELERLFGSDDGLGAVMAGRYVEGVGDSANVRLSASALAGRLISAVRREDPA